jgi:hypothetical protein
MGYLIFLSILEDLLSMFNDFHVGHFDISQLNRAVICLLPKVSECKTISDFRPISLLNCSYNFFYKGVRKSFSECAATYY